MGSVIARRRFREPAGEGAMSASVILLGSALGSALVNSGVRRQLTSASFRHVSFSAKAVRVVKVADRSSSIHPGPVHIAFLVGGKTRRGAMSLSLPTSALA